MSALNEGMNLINDRMFPDHSLSVWSGHETTQNEG